MRQRIVRPDRQPPAAIPTAHRDDSTLEAAADRTAAAALRRPAPVSASRVVIAATTPPARALPGVPTDGGSLDAETRAFMEPRFGHDFAAVRIHADATAAQSARALRAQAYTTGDHIAFAAGRFAPSTDDGRVLLAHELAHVIEQRQSGVARIARKPDDAAGPQSLSKAAVQEIMARSKSLDDLKLRLGLGPVTDEGLAAYLTSKGLLAPKKSTVKSNYSGPSIGPSTEPYDRRHRYIKTPVDDPLQFELTEVYATAEEADQMQVQADFAEFLDRGHAALAAGATVSPNSASDRALSGVTPRITSPGRQSFGGSSKPPAATIGPATTELQPAKITQANTEAKKVEPRVPVPQPLQGGGGGNRARSAQAAGPVMGAPGRPLGATKAESNPLGQDLPARGENLTAEALHRHIGKTVQQPDLVPEMKGRLATAQREDGLDTAKVPDYLVETPRAAYNVWDAATQSPGTASPESALKTVRDKIAKGQAVRIVINLDFAENDLPTFAKELKAQIKIDRQGPPAEQYTRGVKQIVVVKGGNLLHVFP